MRLIDVKLLKNGDKLGRSIYDDYGNLLLGKGVFLTNSLLTKILAHNIYYVYLDDQFSEGIEPQGMLREKSMVTSVQTIKSIMTKILNNENANSTSGIIPLKEYQLVENLIKKIMDELGDNPDMLYLVTELIGTDMYTYQHSVNVAILSILTFRKLGYNEKLIKNISMGALLHDIGKVRINNELINKQDTLTDEEFLEMKNHASYGYDMIKKDCLLSAHAKSVIKYHHEKLDGTGYPSGLEGEAIPEYVRVITICDMYDAMTTDRSYRKRMPIYKALEILMGESVYKIDGNIYKSFIQNICVYPLGSGVRLSDGRIGIIKEYRKEFPDRPTIRIANRKKKSNFEEVDLLIDLTLFIDSTVDIENK